MPSISYEDFERVEMRVGTIVDVLDFPEARKPAYRLTIDFGELGLLRSSAQITKFYDHSALIGRQILAVVNFPPKRIAGFASEVLVLGVSDSSGNVILVSPERAAPNGARLF